MGEIIFLILLAAVGGYYYFESLGYTVGRFDTTGGGGIFPRAIIIVLFVLLAARLIEILIKKEKAPFKFFGYLKGVGGVFFRSFVAFVALWLTRSCFLSGRSTISTTKLTTTKNWAERKRSLFGALRSLPMFCWLTGSLRASCM